MLYHFARSVLRILFTFIYNLEPRGLEHIPHEGAVMLCSNHKSLQDPITLAVTVPRKVHYMAKEELFRIPLFGRFIRALGAFPVKRGGVSKEAIRKAISLLDDGEVLGIFPEGTRSNKIDKGKRGALAIAVRTDAVVIPVAIVGKYRLFRKMRIIYGAPIDLNSFKEKGTTASLDETTEVLMSCIRKMVQTEQPV